MVVLLPSRGGERYCPNFYFGWPDSPASRRTHAPFEREDGEMTIHGAHVPKEAAQGVAVAARRRAEPTQGRHCVMLPNLVRLPRIPCTQKASYGAKGHVPLPPQCSKRIDMVTDLTPAIFTGRSPMASHDRHAGFKDIAFSHAVWQVQRVARPRRQASGPDQSRAVSPQHSDAERKHAGGTAAQRAGKEEVVRMRVVSVLFLRWTCGHSRLRL